MSEVDTLGIQRCATSPVDSNGCKDHNSGGTKSGINDNKASSLQIKVDLQRANFTGTPWIKRDECYHAGVAGLHQEILHFYEFMTPSPEEHWIRMNVVDRIRRTVKSIWPQVDVEIYGSVPANLYLPTSDIDLTITGKYFDLSLFTLKRALLAARIADDDGIKVLDKASVPILKLVDRDTTIKVDISFNMRNAVKSAKLIQKFVQKFPSLPKLVVVLKQYLLQKDLNEVFTGGISSYSLILMTISFLQLHSRREDVTSVNANLGILLIEFLQLYGQNFNYSKYAIRINDGGSYVLKSDMEKQMGDYGFKPSILCIEDPFDPSNDICRSSYGVVNVKKAFESALITLRHACCPSFIFTNASILGTIIGVDEKMVRFRQWIKEKVRGQSNVMYGYNVCIITKASSRSHMKRRDFYASKKQRQHSK